MKILPSIIASDLTNIAGTIKKHTLTECHFDVMDGVFVPEISIGSFVAKQLRDRFPSLKLDVHLMVYDPVKQVENFISLDNVYRVIFHFEGSHHHRRLAEKIKVCGKEAGIAVNPETPPEFLQYVLDVFDCVCIMTVSPGYAGQTLIQACLQKVDVVRTYRDRINPRCKIVLDGGITSGIIADLEKRGVDEVVMGSAFFGSLEGC